jgi:hypothetical protein
VDDAVMHRVSSMLAAGWGGVAVSMELAGPDTFGSLDPNEMSSMRYSVSMDPLSSPSMPGSLLVQHASDSGMAARALDAEPASLEAIALTVYEHLANGGQVRGLAAHCGSLRLHADLRLCLEQVVGLGIDADHALLLLAMWVNERQDGQRDIVMTTSLQPWVEALDAGLVINCNVLLAQMLGAYPVDSWPESRSRRIKRAMARSAC